MREGKLSLKILLDFRKDYRTTTHQLIEKYGDKFLLKNPLMRLHIFSDPKFLEHILFKNYTNYIRPASPIFDPLINSSKLPLFQAQERWKKFRALILNPLMNETGVKRHTEKMVEVTNHHLAEWEKKLGEVTPFYIYPDLEQLTFKNLAATELGGMNLDVHHVTELIDEMGSLEISWEVSLTRLAWKLPTKTRHRTRKLVKEITTISDEIIKYGLSDKIPKEHRLFKDVANSQGADYNDPKLQENLELWSFLRSIAGGYVVAGFDTLSRVTAVNLSFLSRFPKVADNIREEVKRVIGDGEITRENVDALQYTRAVFHEGLRYSGGVLPMMTRQVVNDEKIDDYQLRKNDRVLIPLFYIGHIPQYWENPEAYDPERFLNINLNNPRYRYIYVPFSAGVHGCTGRQFAVLEGTILLAMILRKYRLELLPNQKIDSDFPGTIAMYLTRA